MNTKQNQLSVIGVYLNPLVVIGGATAFCLLWLAFRWFYRPGGELLQMTLLLGAIGCSIVLYRSRHGMPSADMRLSAAGTALQIAFAFVAVATLAAWTPSVTLGILLVAIVVAPFFLPPRVNELAAEGAPTIPAAETSESTSAAGSDASAVLQTTEMQLCEESETESDNWTRMRDELIADPTIRQTMTRWQSDDGAESLVATLRCPFAAGQQSLTLHLPVWPFLPSQPTVYSDVVAGPDARINVSESRIHGIRLDIRLASQAAQPLELVVEVMATAEADGQQAPHSSDAAA